MGFMTYIVLDIDFPSTASISFARAGIKMPPIDLIFHTIYI